MSPLGGWSVGISTIVAMMAYSTVQWIRTAFRRFTRPTRSALTALSGALLTRLLSRISQLDGLRLGLRFVIIELSIALVTVLATVDVDKARATALLIAIAENLDLVSALSSTIDLAIVSYYKVRYIYSMCTYARNFATLVHILSLIHI